MFTVTGKFDTLGITFTEVTIVSGTPTFSFLLTILSFGILLFVNRLSLLVSMSFFSRLVGLSAKLLDDDEGGEYGG